MSWRSDKPATLVYAEALDGGDPATKVDFRDEVFLWNAPFDAATTLVKNTTTLLGYHLGNDNTAHHQMNGTTLEIQKTYIKPSNPSQAQSNFRQKLPRCVFRSWKF
jgi:hypothetical protein